MKIHAEVEQGSVEWFALRAGKVTASEADALVTPLGKVKTGDGPKTLLMQKLAEAWTGAPLPQVTVWDMDQGQYLEEKARPAFELELGLPVTRVGFISSDDGRIGCSPDGIIKGEMGLELKCPHVEKHVRYLLDGCVPPDYVAQVQFSLYATGFKGWYFASYRRRLPMLIIPVLPNPDYHKSIKEALTEFNERFDAGWTRLCEINGGPPKRPDPAAKTPEELESEHPVGIMP